MENICYKKTRSNDVGGKKKENKSAQESKRFTLSTEDDYEIFDFFGMIVWNIWEKYSRDK